MVTWKATVTYWWNLPQYVVNEMEEVNREFRATLDVSDITRDRIVPKWRYNAVGVLMAALWLPLSFAFLAVAQIVAVANGVCKSVLPWVLHWIRRAFVTITVMGTPHKEKPVPKKWTPPTDAWYNKPTNGGPQP